MQVVYPYIKNRSRELKYSVASLINVDHQGVFVIGEMPEFEVHAGFRTPIKEPISKTRSGDQINRYEFACDILKDDELLLMNDDFFIMKPWQPENFNRGTLDQHIAERRMMDSYQRELILTNKYLKKIGLPTIDYEVHTPMLVKRDLLKQAIKEISPDLRNHPVLIRSYYGNRFNIESTLIEDVKNPIDYKDSILLSTSNKTFADGVIGDYIRRQFA